MELKMHFQTSFIFSQIYLHLMMQNFIINFRQSTVRILGTRVSSLKLSFGYLRSILDIKYRCYFLKHYFHNIIGLAHFSVFTIYQTGNNVGTAAKHRATKCRATKHCISKRRATKCHSAKTLCFKTSRNSAKTSQCQNVVFLLVLISFYKAYFWG
jgi:hypothetical protein